MGLRSLPFPKESKETSSEYQLECEKYSADDDRCKDGPALPTKSARGVERARTTDRSSLALDAAPASGLINTPTLSQCER